MPVIVIAGINSSGKTTLLKYIADFDTTPKFDGKDRMNIYLNGSNLTIYKDSKKKKTSGINDYKNSIIYLPVAFDNMMDLKKRVISYIDELMFEKDYKASEAYKELQENINEIFDGLDLKVSFYGLNKKREIYFTNPSGGNFGIDELSTGEKTLLSKVLHLYLSEIRNKVILIDEPELSLHPNWQNQIMGIYEKFAQKNNNQIIIATHSPHILASTKKECIRLLTITGKHIDVVSDFQQAYGLEFSKVLTEIMDVEYLRTPVVEKIFQQLKKNIISDDFETAEKLWNELAKHLGKEDIDLKLTKLEMETKKKSGNIV